MMFTHYSLFFDLRTLEDFAPLPSGGLPELLAQLHSQILPEKPTHCIAVTPGCLHPDGQQISFGLGCNGQEEFKLILMSRECVAEHAGELASEGNHEAANRAACALA